MKILFDGIDFSSPYRNGPTVFAKRLALQLLGMGHIIADSDDYDVVIAFIEKSFQTYKKPLVQRLDGIWFKDEHEFKTKNKNIKLTYDYADHVVFQSQFDKNMIQHWWGEKPHSVIGNGIIINPIKDPKQVAPELLDIRSKHDFVFCCSANWHGQKRLRTNIELFRYLKDSFYKSSCLIVMGSNPEQIPGSDIYYTGNVPHVVSEQVYAISDWMIHLAYLDHCPNTVIESLMQSTPVICSSSGGTKELVGEFGLILNETSEYRYELTNYESPPKLDVTQIKTPLPLKTDLGPANACIDIRDVAKKYIMVFENVINGRQ